MSINRICPECGKKITARGEGYPFCSKRCKSVDLAKWLGGEYRVGGAAHMDADEADALLAALEAAATERIH